MSSIRSQAWPSSKGASSLTQAATESAFPSTIGSPQPTRPLLVESLRNSHLGGTLKSSILSIMPASEITRIPILKRLKFRIRLQCRKMRPLLSQK